MCQENRKYAPDNNSVADFAFAEKLPISATLFSNYVKDHFHEMQNDLESLKDGALEQKAVKSARNGGQQFLKRSIIDTLKIKNGKGKP